ncbi:MAG TPA: hypothetical protein V6D28_10815 [Leptolyngbyaceae cyanobacterium]
MDKKTEPKSRIPRLEKKYQDETRLWLILLSLVFVVLLFFSFAQFAILDNFFKTTFDIPDRAKVFGIPTNNLLGFIATATLPITVLIDESNILNEKVKLILPFISNRLSTIWIVFIADLLLTSLAFWQSNQSREFSILLNLFTSFMIGASFSTFILYLTKGITAVGTKAGNAWRNWQIVSVYGIDPVPYGDDEKVRLSTEAEMAREEVKNLQEKLQGNNLKYDREIQILKDKITTYENYLGSLVQLKENFHQFKAMFQDMAPKSQAFFDKFSAIEESISNFIMPKFETKFEIKETPEKKDDNANPVVYKTTTASDVPEPTSKSNSPEVEKTNLALIHQTNHPITRLQYQNQWHNLTLPSDISPLVSNLLKAMEQENFPVPNVVKYIPRNNVGSCTVLEFEPYKIVVYCRDENYMRGETWTGSDELKFKCKLIQQTTRGFVTLSFNEEELITDISSILEQIKSAIVLRTSMNVEE